MRTKAVSLLLALGLLAVAEPARAELLKLGLLDKPVPRFTLKLDIFRGGAEDGAVSVPTGSAAPAEILQRTIAEEIAQSVSYEGFILKNSKPFALLNVSGEFFAVSKGEMIMDKIRILEITREIVIIEYDSQPYEIRIKGDHNG